MDCEEPEVVAAAAWPYFYYVSLSCLASFVLFGTAFSHIFNSVSTLSRTSLMVSGCCFCVLNDPTPSYSFL